MKKLKFYLVDDLLDGLGGGVKAGWGVGILGEKHYECAGGEPHRDSIAV